jgi:putative ABC transport system permease protein
MINEIKPPKIFHRFFRWFCHPKLQKSIEGDLLELYEEAVRESGKRKANLRFVRDVMLLFRPSIIKPSDGTYRLNNYGMIKNYMKVSVRNIARNKTFSTLNIIGLSIGMAACVLISIFVKNELSYDTYNSQYDNIYRVLIHYGFERDVEADAYIPIEEYQVWGSAPVGPAIQEYFPEIESVFRFTSPNAWLVEYQEKRFQENNIIFGDSTAFDIFDWPVIAGNPNTALIRPNTIVLTQEMAKKYFGDANPIGEMLIMDSVDPFEVTAVIELPSNTHFDFDAMISMSTFRMRRASIFDQWGYVDFYTYFMVNPHANMSNMKQKIKGLLQKYGQYESGITITFEPLADAYLNSAAGRQPGTTGSLSNIYVFGSIAVFILLIACINFMNLSTARSVERAKEVAIRKTIGSYRRSLIAQFLMEAVIITFIAAILAGVMILLGHSYLEYLSDKALPIDWLFSIKNSFIAVVFILLIGGLAGLYPAIVLSGFKPIKVLKGAYKNSSQGVWLRKSLVILQFSLSIILLVGTSVIYSQLKHLRNHELGFDADQVLVIDFGWDFRVQNKLRYIKEQLSNHPEVSIVSASRATPGDFFPNGGTQITQPNGEIISKSPAVYEIDEDFTATYKMKIVAGRSFSNKFPLDSSNSLMLNESAAALFGYPNPEDIIGKSFEQWGREGKVIGVVGDFNYVSLHNTVEPLSLRYATSGNTSMLSLSITSTNYGKTLREIKDIWSTVVPYHPFIGRFKSQSFNEQYQADERFGVIVTTFSGLAIFVACLGLFGLTIYSTTQKAKEIGIRKVLGASTGHIVGILSKDFVILYAISLLFAIPISWYAMSSWLDDFAYRISMGWELFFISSLITFLIAMLTMSGRTVMTALSNPVKSLRSE